MKVMELKFSFGDQQASNKRLAEMVLFISEKSRLDDGFSKTKLNKILYFSDFYSYIRLGRPVTGTEYMKLDHGPVPRQIMPVIDDLEFKKALAMKHEIYFGYPREVPTALREPNLSSFDGEQVAIVEQIIRHFWGSNATEVSNLSHGRAWRAAGDRESIPYEAAYISDEPVSQRDRELEKELSAAHGW